MLVLDSSEVRIGGKPRDKTEAIRQVGALLVESGHIEPGYVESMLARERVADTLIALLIVKRPLGREPTKGPGLA